MKFEQLIGSGRIIDIIMALKSIYGVDDTRLLDEPTKLNALLTTLDLDADELDSLIADNSPVYRTVKGHAFEIVFEFLLKATGIDITDVGGDGNVDMMVNEHRLQLKTPNAKGCTDEIVQYKTHKTHGAKSENESMEYYHGVDEFADFLVGLVSYDPLNLLILKRDELPKHSKSAIHIASPFNVSWKSHEGLNNFGRIGLNNIMLDTSLHFPTDISMELLPKTAKRLNLRTNLILDTILNASNFRVWDMAIRGWAREVAVNRLFAKNNIHFVNPTDVRKLRGLKSDFALKKKSLGYDFFQVKGPSFNNCIFNGPSSVIATETQLTRGRVNDHPTQSRLYLKSDFDYLLLCVDPPIVQMFDKELGIDGGLYWKYYCIPTTVLKVHHVFNNRLKSLQSFNIIEIEKYAVTPEMLNSFL